MRMSTKTQLNFVNGTSRQPRCRASSSTRREPMGRVGVADQRHGGRAVLVAIDAVRGHRSGQGKAASIGAERVGVGPRPREGRRQIGRQRAVDPGNGTRRGRRLPGDDRGRRGRRRRPRRRRPGGARPRAPSKTRSSSTAAQRDRREPSARPRRRSCRRQHRTSAAATSRSPTTPTAVDPRRRTSAVVPASAKPRPRPRGTMRPRRNGSSTSAQVAAARATATRASPNGGGEAVAGPRRGRAPPARGPGPASATDTASTRSDRATAAAPSRGRSNRAIRQHHRRRSGRPRRASAATRRGPDRPWSARSPRDSPPAALRRPSRRPPRPHVAARPIRGAPSASSPPAASCQARVGSEKYAQALEVSVSTPHRTNEPARTAVARAAIARRGRPTRATSQQQDRPQQVELLLDGERPEVEHRRGVDGREVVGRVDGEAHVRERQAGRQAVIGDPPKVQRRERRAAPPGASRPARARPAGRMRRARRA